MQRRGLRFTRGALDELNRNPYYDLTPSILFQWHQEDYVGYEGVPFVFMLRDGTCVMVRLGVLESDPYTIDFADGKFWFQSDDERLEEIYFCKRPAYYGKKTGSGVDMREFSQLKGPDCIIYVPYRHCHYWNDNTQCRFCDIVHNLKHQMRMGRAFKTRVNFQDIYELTKEILEESGRYRSICITGGSDARAGSKGEFDYYLGVIKAIRKAFLEFGYQEDDCLQIVLEMSPLEKDEMLRLFEAGVLAFGGNLEIWDPEKFKLVCPGKDKYITREAWIDRLLMGVEIFGWGNIYSTFCMGPQMAPKPYGVGPDGDIDEAVDSALEGIEFFLKNKVMILLNFWSIEPGSYFYKIGATQPPLEFYTKMAMGTYRLEKKYSEGRFPDYRCYRDDCGPTGTSSFHRLL